MVEPQYDAEDMFRFYEIQELRDLRRLLVAAKATIQQADEEGWLYYNGTDKSRLAELEEAVDRIENR